MKSCILLVLLLLGQTATRPENGTISGRVLNPDGSPAAGVRVAAMSMESVVPTNKSVTSFSSLAQTDATGTFQLENVPPGRYYISAGILETPTYYPGVPSRVDAQPVALSNGATVRGIEFKLAQPNDVKVQGRVSNIPQRAPRGLFGASLISPSRNVRMQTKVGDDGSFEFLQVPAGDYLLRVTPGGSPVAVSVRGKNISDLSLELLPVVFGRIRVEGGSSLPIHRTGPDASDDPAMVRFTAVPAQMATLATPPVAAVGRAGTTDALVRSDGVMVLAVIPGDYWIRVSMLPLGYYLKEMSYRGVDLRQNSVRLEQANIDEIQITLTRTAPPNAPAGVKVSGKVTDMGVLRPGPVWIPLRTTGPPVTDAGGMTTLIAEALVNSDGTFEFVGIPSGRYLITSAEFPGPEVVVVSGQDVRGIVLSAASARPMGTPRNP